MNPARIDCAEQGWWIPPIMTDIPNLPKKVPPTGEDLVFKTVTAIEGQCVDAKFTVALWLPDIHTGDAIGAFHVPSPWPLAPKPLKWIEKGQGGSGSVLAIAYDRPLEELEKAALLKAFEGAIPTWFARDRAV